MVDALIAAVEDAAPRIAHRYYGLKARWMGTDTLDYWDRSAPLPEDDDRAIGWDEAVSTVLSAYDAFSPELAAIGRRFFEGDWIDVPVRKGKAPGAFAHPTVPGAHPYLLLNYQGKTRDVMILAHELGPRRPPSARGRAGPAAGGDAADTRRDRLRLRRAAYLPRAARWRERSRGAAG